MGLRNIPVERVGLYVPGGLAPLASSVIMNVVPAQVAGVSLRAVSDPRAPTAPGRGALVHRGAARPIQIADDTPGLPCGVIPQDRRRIKDSGL